MDGALKARQLAVRSGTHFTSGRGDFRRTLATFAGTPATRSSRSDRCTGRRGRARLPPRPRPRAFPTSARRVPPPRGRRHRLEFDLVGTNTGRFLGLPPTLGLPGAHRGRVPSTATRSQQARLPRRATLVVQIGRPRLPASSAAPGRRRPRRQRRLNRRRTYQNSSITGAKRLDGGADVGLLRVVPHDRLGLVDDRPAGQGDHAQGEPHAELEAEQHGGDDRHERHHAGPKEQRPA